MVMTIACKSVAFYVMYFIKKILDFFLICSKVGTVRQAVKIAKEYEEAAKRYIDGQVKTFGECMKTKINLNSTKLKYYCMLIVLFGQKNLSPSFLVGITSLPCLKLPWAREFLSFGPHRQVSGNQ